MIEQINIAERMQFLMITDETGVEMLWDSDEIENKMEFKLKTN